MEFCPEVAVIQSAFQLVKTKAGMKLENVSKTECSDYVNILKTTLTEICHGLEYDHDLLDQLLWRKNMHTLILYALVKKVYKPTDKKEGVPVYNPLDVLVQVLPTFSCQLYFELVKDCSWEQLLLNSLLYLEPSVSQQILKDLMCHCTQEPISCGDYKILNSLKDALMTALLSVPFELDSVVDKQLKPLSKADKYIPLIRDDVINDDTNNVETVTDPKTAELKEVDLLRATNQEDLYEVSQEEMEDRVHASEHENLEAGANCEVSSQADKQTVDKIETNTKIRTQKDFHTLDNGQFWSNFLHESCSFLEEILFFFENHVHEKETLSEHFQYLIQLGIIGFILTEKNTSGPQNKWLLFNMFQEADTYTISSAAENSHTSEISLSYIMNVTLADTITAQLTENRWSDCIHKILKNAIEKKGQKSLSTLAGTSEMSTDLSESQPNLETPSGANTLVGGSNFDAAEDFHIIAGLSLRKDVLYRMIEGCFVELENMVTKEASKLLIECRDMMTELFYSKSLEEMMVVNGDTENITVDTMEQGGSEIEKPDTLKVNRVEATEIDTFDDTGRKNGMEVICGDSWRSDVTLEALCWRIRNRLSYCQDCVEMLLDPWCTVFWSDERVYDTFIEQIQLLVSKSRVIRLVEILGSLEQVSDIVTLKAHQLTCRAFSGLSFLDQDAVAMEIYVKNETVRGFLGLEDVQLMTVFNRITALRDDQILSELFLLCLYDPRDVISTAVKMSVRNKEQAENFAQVLQFFPSICQTSHPTHHPDCSLLGHAIREFLVTTNLSDKEQTAFVVFLSTLLQLGPTVYLGKKKICFIENEQINHIGKVPSNQKKLPLLSPLELLHQCIMPFIGVDSLHSDGPITCKFALTMLKTVLECDCNKYCDWTEFEPVALLLCLTELLQDCVEFWNSEDELRGLTKITVKSLVHKCLTLFGQMLKDALLVFTEKSTEWFYHCLMKFDLPVVIQLEEVLICLGLEQIYQEDLQSLQLDYDSDLVSILLIAGAQPQIMQLGTVHQATRVIDYDELLVAMIQVLPNLLSSEFENTVGSLMSLIDQEVFSVPYRVQYTLQIPLITIKDFQSIIGVSQVLRDVIITLGLICDRRDIQHHVLQCYTACIKAIINTIKQANLEVQLFILSQIFHHVCDMVQLLPHQTTEPVLVLLLHLLTLYADTLADSESHMKRHKWKKRMADSVTGNIQLSVELLPETLVEKEMLLKKIKNVS